MPAHSVRMVGILGALLAVTVAQSAPPQSSKADKNKARHLATIKRLLKPQGEKDTSWYVIVLQEVTRKKDPFLNTITEKRSARFVKVQGQDAAANAVYEFLRAPNDSVRNFVYRSFPDTEPGRKLADDVYSKQITLGMLQGGRLQ